MKKLYYLAFTIIVSSIFSCGVLGTAVGGDLESYEAEYKLPIKDGKTVAESLRNLEKALVNLKLNKKDEDKKTLETDVYMILVSYSKVNTITGVATGKHTIKNVTATIVSNEVIIRLTINYSTNFYASAKKGNEELFDKIKREYESI
ncbi:MAG: hypothetical protein GKR88_14975 [Flavobacteriaceae bacterium]|nr:MAG: hypothetical protein GKR88_14975 [Flavobacteriaceae bacterium]